MLQTMSRKQIDFDQIKSIQYVQKYDKEIGFF